ncbi:MDR family MFS transporter [Pelagibacterium halotolerans]|uniref:MDR family MFS transporter n=1 Tax=Pelagibacterium halotolerans TaxID=531813 RepID=UPI00384BFACE
MIDTPVGASLSPTRKLTIYLAVLFGLFMATLDAQIIATALPTIAADLGKLELFGWVGAAYLLATASVTPFYGKLGDLFGRKPVFMAAIILFVLGSLACGLAWSMEALIAARVLQGIGGGGLMTSAFAVIADLFEPRERAKYQGFTAAAFTLSNLVGPVAGGVISQAIGWPFVFLVNLPIGIAVIAVVVIAMPRFETGRSPKIDYIGGFLLAAAVTLAVFWAEEVVGNGYGGAMGYVLPVLVVLSATGFVLVERRAVEPIIPLRLFADSTISLTLIISVLAGVTTLGMLNYFALFLQTVTGLPPALAGLLFLPASVGSLVASIGSGYLVARSGRYKIYPVISMALGIAVLLVFATVHAGTPVWFIGGLMFLFSISIGLQMQTLMVAVQAAAPHRDVGAATGALTLARMVGASLGLAANGGLLTAALTRGQAVLSPQTLTTMNERTMTDMTPDVIATLPPAAAAEVVETFSGAFGTLFYFGAAMLAAGLVCALMMKDVRLGTPEKQEPQASAEAQPAVAE